MSYPVIEQVSQAIQTLIEGVTVDNGYNVTVSAVYRPTKIGGVRLRDKSVILELDGKDLDTDGPDGWKTWWVNYSLSCLISPSDNDETPVDTYIAEFASDIEKALVGHEQFVGLITNGTVMDSEVVDGTTIDSMDGSMTGMHLTLRVQVRHLYEDPYA